MSMCPNSDLFSALVDNEIPSPWKEKLEAHIRACPDCAQQMAHLALIKNLVKESEPSIAADFLESSWQKLALKIKTKEEIELRTPQHVHFFKQLYSASVRIPVAALAALLVVVLFIPVRINSKKQPSILASAINYETRVSKSLQLQKISTSNSVYSPDLPATSINPSYISSSDGKVFKLIQVATEHSDILNSDTPIIKLPDLTSFNGSDDFLSQEYIPKLQAAGFYQ